MYSPLRDLEGKSKWISKIAFHIVIDLAKKQWGCKEVELTARSTTLLTSHRSSGVIFCVRSLELWCRLRCSLCKMSLLLLWGGSLSLVDACLFSQARNVRGEGGGGGTLLEVVVTLAMKSHVWLFNIYLVAKFLSVTNSLIHCGWTSIKEKRQLMLKNIITLLDYICVHKRRIYFIIAALLLPPFSQSETPDRRVRHWFLYSSELSFYPQFRLR